MVLPIVRQVTVMQRAPKVHLRGSTESTTTREAGGSDMLCPRVRNTRPIRQRIHSGMTTIDAIACNHLQYRILSTRIYLHLNPSLLSPVSEHPPDFAIQK